MLNVEQGYYEKKPVLSSKWALIFITWILSLGAYPAWVYQKYHPKNWQEYLIPKSVAFTKESGFQKNNANIRGSSDVQPVPFEITPRIVEGSISKNDTLTSLLIQEGIPSKTIHKMVQAASLVFNLNRIQKGNLYRITFGADDRMMYFDYAINSDRYLRITRKNQTFKPSLLNFSYEIATELLEGEIQSNLITAIQRAGGTFRIALDLAEIFSWDIDFFKDIRKGDSFKLLVEKKFYKNQFMGYGNILATRFFNQGQEFNAIHFKDEKGGQNYYDSKGQPLAKQFLKAPLKYQRISSKFTYRRFHPVYKTYLPHRSVDYAAPLGTPIHAVADGTVAVAERNRRSGNFITIQHNRVYQTSYSHLFRFTKGIKKGALIRQGQVIGYVGKTGAATGPHLCFRITKYGQPINPLTFKSPEGKFIDRRFIQAFQRITRERILMLEGGGVKQALKTGKNLSDLS